MKTVDKSEIFIMEIFLTYSVKIKLPVGKGTSISLNVQGKQD
jgi:hypothetical protein